MSQYAKLDALIVQAIADGRHPLYNGPCRSESERIAASTGRDEFRVIDGRLQILRRRGSLKFEKTTINGKVGWKVAA